MKIFSPKRYVNTNRAFLAAKKLTKSVFENKYIKTLNKKVLKRKPKNIEKILKEKEK